MPSRAASSLTSLTALGLGLALTVFPCTVVAIDLSRFYGNFNSKSSDDACRPYEPFKCPGDGTCISIQYLCDGAPDCRNGYDEDTKLCTAGKCFYSITFLLFIFCCVYCYLFIHVPTFKIAMYDRSVVILQGGSAFLYIHTRIHILHTYVNIYTHTYIYMHIIYS
ncbi:hypothetical protein M0802_016814 [Mischocyttarus mexicanus]|nr:hypothetical protein M0802_016814 [Mischocyttarus mexicanus]